MITLPHDRSAFFTTEKYWNAVARFFVTELENDGSDITSSLTIGEHQLGSATIISKEEGMLAGQSEVDSFFSQHYPRIQFSFCKQDGQYLNSGDTLLEMRGNVRDILKAERVLLNTLSRMSGIATQTHAIQSELSTPIAATRKTQWSYLDKKAVFVGGGFTHRIGLFDAVLIKENHLIAMGNELLIMNPDNKAVSFFEVETETKEEFFRIFNVFLKKGSLQGIPKVIMLDNFIPESIIDLLSDLEQRGWGRGFRHSKSIFLEASGGITTQNISDYDTSGVDVLSLGMLTNWVKPLDFSLRMKG